MVLPGNGRGLLRIILTIMESSLQSGGFLSFYKIVNFL